MSKKLDGLKIWSKKVDKKKNIGLTRRKADELLEKVIQRAFEVNSAPDTEFLHTIKRIAVFGSYLTDKEKLGDLDIAVDLENRWTFGTFDEKLKNLSGLDQKSYFERLFWPETKLWRFLKQRSTGISLHEWRDIEKGGYRHKIVFEEK
jgi:predicted nucleotidyltransferase